MPVVTALAGDGIAGYARASTARAAAAPGGVIQRREAAGAGPRERRRSSVGMRLRGATLIVRCRACTGEHFDYDEDLVDSH